MLKDFEFIGVLGSITLTIPIVTLIIAWALRPKKPNPAKKKLTSPVSKPSAIPGSNLRLNTIFTPLFL